jgi:hypothetical protein
MVLGGWRKEVRKNRPTGAFGETIHKPPTIKPNKVFAQLNDEPELFGRLTQVRTMHGYNPDYVRRFKLDRDENCACGPVEFRDAEHVREHVFFQCDEYLQYRRGIFKICHIYDPGRIFGTTKGLFATVDFLRSSGAFTSSGAPYVPPKTPELPGLVLTDPP